MSLFFIDPTQISNNRAIIGGKNFHHLHNVLRLKEGDYLQISDGQQFLYRAKIEKIGRHEAQALIVETSTSNSNDNLKIIIGQALPKGQKMDLIIEKGTELGATVFVPLLTERVVVRVSATLAGKRLERWQKIALAASRQSGRLTVPEVYSPMSLSEFCQANSRATIKIILWEKASLRLKELPRLPSLPEEVAIIIGPEGGFSQQEVMTAEHSGFISLLLGERILRTETSSLALLSILQFIWGNLG